MYKKIFFGAAIVLSFLIVNALIGCPVKFLTGLSCAGCGMTRAIIALLQLDIKSAFYFHPMVFVMPFCLAAVLFIRWIPEKILKKFIVCISVAFIVVYFVRLFSPNQVVSFNLESGLAYKIISKISGIFFA